MPGCLCREGPGRWGSTRASWGGLPLSWISAPGSPLGCTRRSGTVTHGQWDPERRPQGQHAGDDRGQGRQCRHPGPAPRGPRRPVLERRPGEVSGFAEGRGRPGRDVSVLRTAWPPLAGSPLLPASRRVPLPSSAGASLPLLFSARSKGRTQASGTRRRSASSIPALFSFRGRPPKYPAR